MLRAFNSLQLVSLFTIFPFGINWLFQHATFTGANIVGWISCVVYFIFFIMMTTITYTSFTDEKNSWL